MTTMEADIRKSTLAAQPAVNGAAVLRNPILNNDGAFTLAERRALRLDGLPPPSKATTCLSGSTHEASRRRV